MTRPTGLHTTRKATRKKSDRTTRSAPGENTLKEILSQPDTWRETAVQLGQQDTITRLAREFSAAEPWLFLACGSSHYLCQVVASLWTEELKTPCTSVPASEFLFAPEELLRRSAARNVVLLSRSGETSEVLRAARLLEGRPGIQTLGVTCNAAGPLEALVTHKLKLNWADEKSMVMTRSFTSILLAFERLAAKMRGDAPWTAALDRLPERSQRWLDGNAGKMRAFGGRRTFGAYIFLGQGAHHWLAQEAALKLTEMSSSYAQAYHSLEFRHGPKSIAGRNTLVTFLVSDRAEESETVLAGELKQLGASIVMVVNRGTPAISRVADLVVELEVDEPEPVRLPVAAMPAHLLGYAVGRRKGLNPDAPKNLTRAVILGNNGSAPTRRT